VRLVRNRNLDHAALGLATRLLHNPTPDSPLPIPVHAHQRDFLRLALDRQALRFGEFTLKSGRISPYFFNAGRFDSGAALAELGECYAEALLASGLGFDMLFGPAYKGIPLATALAVALSRRGIDVPVAFDRKESKNHGEGGQLMGAPLAGRVLIVDDVITAGTAIRHSLGLIEAAGARPCGVLLALDRQERGQGERSAVQEIAEDFGLPVVALVRLADLLELAEETADLVQHRSRLLSYREKYGCAV
jgi:orotate phosphoribosyltransferase